jgi:hypothetical protein
MEFASPKQKEIYEKVSGWMKELFGQFAQKHPDFPAFGIIQGSALANVIVEKWGDDDAVVATRAYVVSGADVNADVTHYLLQENNKMRFGAFGMDEKDNIFFQHTIVGSTCDKEELMASVMAVVTTADRYDDEIKSRAGGQSALDMAQEFAAAPQS